jgi:pimeloyl-ACP methyl ester carboxylesterase
MKLVLASTFASQPPRKLPRTYHALKIASAATRPFRKHVQPYYAFMRQLEASRGFVCADRLSDIKAPTLVLHGLKDGIAPFSLAEELHAGIGGSRLVSFKGGHAFSFTQKERFVEEVLGFLDGA